MFQIARSTLEYSKYEKRAKKNTEDTGSNLNVQRKMNFKDKLVMTDV